MKSKEVVVVTVTVAVTVVAVAAVVRHWRRRKERLWKQTQRILRKFARECATPVPKLWAVADALVADMKASLTSEKVAAGSLNMLVSYVAPLPSGEEKGQYYGVNLRDKDFLLICGRLGGRKEPVSDVHKQEISIPDDLIQGSQKELCNYIAAELATFIAMHRRDNIKDSDEEEEKKLGFSFMYPVKQSGSAIQWKGITADDTVGKEFVNEMNQALERHGLKFRMQALVDSTIGDLFGGRYYNKDCVAAITLGMRTNAAYVEQFKEAPRWNGTVPESGEIIISTEWGEFRSGLLPVTEYDVSLDAESSNPGSRIFEKMVSGGYLGEIVRRVLLRMAQESALFGENVPPKLTVPYMLSSPDMAAMHQDTSEDQDIVQEKLSEIFGITNSTPAVRGVVVEVCDIVAERAARLGGAGLVGIIKKLGRVENKRSTVTVEGGLYEHYRVFRNYLNSSVWEMLGNELSDNIIVEHSHGGSGAGAIFFAACGR